MLKPSPHKQDEAAVSASAAAGVQSFLHHRYGSYSPSEAIHAAAEYSLWLGFLSIWWNPCLNEKISRSSANIAGLAEYYKLQMIALAFRAAVHYTVSHGKVAGDSEKALHLFMLVFSIPVSEP